MQILKVNKKRVRKRENHLERQLYFCTCIAIELMIIGIMAYLLFLEEQVPALISGIIFAKVIVFHFMMVYYDKKNLKFSRLYITQNSLR